MDQDQVGTSISRLLLTPMLGHMPLLNSANVESTSVLPHPMFKTILSRQRTCKVQLHASLPLHSTCQKITRPKFPGRHQCTPIQMSIQNKTEQSFWSFKQTSKQTKTHPCRNSFMINYHQIEELVNLRGSVSLFLTYKVFYWSIPLWLPKAYLYKQLLLSKTLPPGPSLLLVHYKVRWPSSSHPVTFTYHWIGGGDPAGHPPKETS